VTSFNKLLTSRVTGTPYALSSK